MTESKSRGSKTGLLLICLGVFYMCFAGFGFMFSFLQVSMLERLPQKLAILQGRFLLPMHEVWRMHLPWIFGLGGLYVGFGYLLPRLGRSKFLVNWMLLVLTQGLALSYLEEVLPVLEVISQIMPFSVFPKLSYVSGVLGAISCLVMATAPQIWIHFLMKKQDS